MTRGVAERLGALESDNVRSKADIQSLIIKVDALIQQQSIYDGGTRSLIRAATISVSLVGLGIAITKLFL